MSDPKINDEHVRDDARPHDEPPATGAADATGGGIPAHLMGTPLGSVLLFHPPRSDNPEENCEGVEYLIARGVPEISAIEAMGLTREQFYYWKLDALRGQNADLEKLIRRYRRRILKDAEKIERLKDLIEALDPREDAAQPDAGDPTGVSNTPVSPA
jgi:hypothetical protein